MTGEVAFIHDEHRQRPEKSMVFRLWCDNKKIKQLTRYQPQVDLNMVLKKTIDWITQPDNLKMYKAEIYNV